MVNIESFPSEIGNKQDAWYHHFYAILKTTVQQTRKRYRPGNKQTNKLPLFTDNIQNQQGIRLDNKA